MRHKKRQFEPSLAAPARFDHDIQHHIFRQSSRDCHSQELIFATKFSKIRLCPLASSQNRSFLKNGSNIRQLLRWSNQGILRESMGEQNVGLRTLQSSANICSTILSEHIFQIEKDNPFSFSLRYFQDCHLSICD